MNKNAISLFSCSGIGELGIKANAITTVANSELLPNRMALYTANHPESKNFLGDIRERKHDIINYYNENFDEELFLLLATPPCQGMSRNGAGKILREYKKGNRPKLDERNRLIIDTLDVAVALKPKWLLLENVPQMLNTSILDDDGNLILIIDYIKKRLGDEYVGGPAVVNTADYGIPQSRQRLITIFSRTEQAKNYYAKNNSFLPPITHPYPEWITLRKALANIPPLDAKKGLESLKTYHELHQVNILDSKKYSWISHTPEGETAFNNQCINPSCLYDKNPLHTVEKNKDSVSSTNHNKTLYCMECGELLPRPYTEDTLGKKKLMKAFASSYKRMCWDAPASTITQNFQFPSSDNKLHPTENRVLSLYEALLLHTITDYEYSFVLDGKLVNKGLIRSTIGESVPPKLFDVIVNHIKGIEGVYDD